MRNVFMFVAAMTVALASASCARFASTPRDYSVSGITHTPEAMVRATSDAYTQVRSAETYDWAVRHGTAYPYEGGYVGTDAAYFYGGVAPTVAPRQGYMPDGNMPATREEVEVVREQSDEAYERATDSLRFHQQHRDWHRGQGR